MVLVTGSMRSGTSSLAGSLKHLGWHVPQPEVPASERNAKGHFEPRWVIEFHKRLMRRALVRPSDGSPRAEERVVALLEDGAVEAELREWLSAQQEPHVVVKDPHAAWVLPLWRRAAGQAGRDLRILTALRHPAAVVGSQDRTWGEGRRSDAERRVKETSNTAAWLNVALVTEAGSRGAPRAFVRYDDLLADWRTALKQVSDQLDLDLPLDEDRGLDAFLDPGMRRSQLTWDDIVLPDWLRDLAEDAWQQLGGLVLDPADAAAGGPDGGAPGGLRRALRRGGRGVARRGAAPGAPRLRRRGGQAAGPAQGRARPPPRGRGQAGGGRRHAGAAAAGSRPVMASDGQRVLFVHVQKTGGQSIEHLLRRHLPDARKVTGLPGAKHATYAAAVRAHPELAGYWSFGFVRNPWARLWSWYQMIERRRATAERGNAWVATRIERNDFWSGVLEHCPDFESFVMEGTERFARLRRPQLDYLRDGGRQVDFIGRTETLAEDVTTVGARLGFVPELDQRNAGGGGDFRRHFTPAMRQRVADLFETDLRAFGYTFE